MSPKSGWILIYCASKDLIMGDNMKRHARLDMPFWRLEEICGDLIGISVEDVPEVARRVEVRRIDHLRGVAPATYLVLHPDLSLSS